MTAHSHRPVRRIGLVLGAGGPVGHAWHCGVLRALAEKIEWDARDAQLIVGTSAGAQVGALVRAGMSPWDLKARVTGDELSPGGHAIAQHYVRPKQRMLVPETRRGPAAPEYLLHTVRRPWTARPGRLAAALLPEGRVTLDRQAEGLRHIFGHEWPHHELWITALNVASGQLVAFGHPEAPRTDVGTAVVCSGAVPTICAPIQVGEHRYVDGGMVSPTNLHLLLHRDDLDLVIVSSPLSRIVPLRLLLRQELRRLRRKGVPVVVFEPSGDAATAMGWNPLDPERGPAVARAAYQATLRDLERPERQRELAPFF